MKNVLLISLMLSIFPSLLWANDKVALVTPTVKGTLPVKSWKSIRDHRVVKQNLDYSCGAASIATLLSEHYGRKTTEAEVLKLLDNDGSQASFDDMQRILPQLGFKGVGLATSWDQLVSLKLPVIVYVRQRKDDHFAVIKGISDKYVSLADPSLGNRTLTRQQFKEIWETRGQPGLEGKMLAVLPLNKATQVTDGSFFKKATFPVLPIKRLRLGSRS